MRGELRVGVVGAGISGCASAFELAARGVDVTVFDARGPGGGATQASAGILAPFIEGHGERELLDLGRRGLDAYDAFVERVRTSSSLDFEYRRTGTLEIAGTADRAIALKERIRSLPPQIPGEWLDGPQLRTFEPSVDPAVPGALYCPVHGFVAVMPFVSALVDAALRRGAGFETVRVHSVRSEPANCVIERDVGRREFDRVVLCAGSWAADLAPASEAARFVRPIKGQLLLLRSSDVRPRCVVWGSSCYIVPWQDGTLLVGATVEDAGFDERPTAEGIQGLLRAGIELVPGTAAATFVGVRVGLRPASRSGMPLIGPSSSDPRVVYATGHFRNGVLLAPHTAELVSSYLLTGQQDPVFKHLNGA